MKIFLIPLLMTVIGGFLEYWACKVKALGIILPAVQVVGILLFVEADKRHAAELMAQGTLPEGLGLFVGLLFMVPLLVGMLLGGIVHCARKVKADKNN